MIRMGDIRWFRFEHPDKRRPVLVVCREQLVPSLSLLPVIPLSTQVRGLPSEVSLGPDDGMPETCVVKPEWIRAVERERLGPLISTLPRQRWPEIRQSLLYILGLE